MYLKKLFIVVGCVLWSCSCNENKSLDMDIVIENSVLLECVMNTRASNSITGQYIKFSAINNSTLRVEENVYINCCTQDISLEINAEGKCITINMTVADGGCNCICERILNYDLCNLQENKKYKIIFLRNNDEYHTGEFVFTKKIDLDIHL